MSRGKSTVGGECQCLSVTVDLGNAVLGRQNKVISRPPPPAPGGGRKNTAEAPEAVGHLQRSPTAPRTSCPREQRPRDSPRGAGPRLPTPPPPPPSPAAASLDLCLLQALACRTRDRASKEAAWGDTRHIRQCLRRSQAGDASQRSHWRVQLAIAEPSLFLHPTLRGPLNSRDPETTELMASSTPSSATSSNAGADPNTTNLRPTTYDTWCGVAHGCTRKLGLKICAIPGLMVRFCLVPFDAMALAFCCCHCRDIRQQAERKSLGRVMQRVGTGYSKSERSAWRVSQIWQLPFGGWVVPSLSYLPSCALGFLQRTNSLEEKSRLVSAFRERQSSKNLLSCENSDPSARFRRTETDFSNLFAQDLLPAKNGEEQTVQFLLEVVDILLNYVRKTFDRSTKVLDFHHPHQLLEGMEGFNLELSDHPESLEQILVDCRDTLKYGVRTGHPRFFNQLSTGLDIIGLAGEWLTSTANTNMFTYEIAPVFVLMEQITLKKMREIIGWSSKDGDGIFSPGGAISNMYSIMAARYKYFPEVKTKGMAAVPKLVLFTSEHGYVPLYVNATAGTTVYGAFDPIQEIADICEKYNLWLHVDAAWGGGLLMSRKHRHKLSGIERANSVTWNPHKMMGVLLQCSAILVKEKGILQGCNQMCAGYLFQPDKQYDVSYDTGDKAIQCGRHVDIFKFWLMWKAKGTVGFENQINKCLELAEYLYAKIKTREEFEMVFDGEVAPKIKALMMESGTTMVGYQPQGDKANFFRMVISNPAATQSDIDFLIEEIERLGQDL
ncbi:glutamic acid decarboxylase 2 [Cricetulus griseus]